MARGYFDRKEIAVIEICGTGKWLYVDEDSKIDILEYNYKIYDLFI